MGNKQQLQLNNETLGSILSNVLGLPSQESLKHGAYVWKKLTAQGGDFVDFVVSDSETAYPDGGEQGGYWYEKVVEGVAGIDFGEVTITTSERPITVEHKLGVVPNHVILIPLFPTKSLAGYSRFAVWDNQSLMDNDGAFYRVEISTTYKDTSIIKFGNTTAGSYEAKFYKGKYLWIALA